MKTYSVAGIACKNNVYQIRFANDLASRYAQLVRDNQTDIILVELGESMTKQQAAEYLLGHSDFQSNICQQTLCSFLNIEPKKSLDDELLLAFESLSE